MVEHDVESLALKTLENLHLKKPNHVIFNLDKLGGGRDANACISSHHNMSCFLFPEKIARESEEESERTNWYTFKEAEQIFEAMNTTFYDQCGFVGNTSNYYNPNNSYIDKVRGKTMRK